MTPPPPGHSPPLIAVRAAEVGDAVVVGDDHAALAGGDLLVGVEAEDSGVAEGADGFAAVLASQPLARIFNHSNLVPAGDRAVLGHEDRVAEGLDREDGFGLGRDRVLDALRVHVQGLGADVHEDRLRADIQNAVRRRDEGKGRGDDLIAGADAHREHEHVQPGGAGGARDGVPTAGARRDRRLELLVHRADREPLRPQHALDHRHFNIRDVRLAQRNLVDHGDCLPSHFRRSRTVP